MIEYNVFVFSCLCGCFFTECNNISEEIFQILKKNFGNSEKGCNFAITKKAIHNKDYSVV